MVDHYEVLGVPIGADPAEIRRAYLKLARRHHPDANPSTEATALVRMAEINQAYEVLRDPEERRRYDAQLRAGTVDGAGRRPTGAPPGKGWTPRHGDDGWMRDFGTWRDETDLLPPDPIPTRTDRRWGSWSVLPVALFALAVLTGIFAMVTTSRALLAGAMVLVAVSAALFLLFPLLAMVRQRRDD